MSSLKKLICWSVAFLAVWAGSPAAGQDTPIIEIPFESLPDGTLVQGAGGITLDGNVEVTQNLNVEGMVESGSGGFRFPDGTVQTTAALAGDGGLYGNRIVAMTPSQLYSEVCFKSGQAFTDIHASSEPTAGGNCVPGDLGFIIERNQRIAANWEDAKVQCLLAEMRLPETFEWLHGCNSAGTYGLNNMTGDWEWISNLTHLLEGSANGIGAHIAGNTNCNSGSWGYLGTSSNAANSFSFRCVR